VSGILVPLRGAEDDVEVVRLACLLARQTKSRVYFLHVIRVPRTLAVDADLPAQTNRGDAILLHAEEEANRQHVESESSLAQAREIGPAIVNEAVDRDVDLVVIGIDPEKGQDRFHVGETASYVLEHAPCPVVAHRQALAVGQPAPD
jgi:nucleotide-binding universal stress UspA family protein